MDASKVFMDEIAKLSAEEKSEDPSKPRIHASFWPLKRWGLQPPNEPLLPHRVKKQLLEARPPISENE